MTFKEKLQQVALVQDEQKRRLKLLDAVVEEFGNDSEKHGIKFALYPLWAQAKTSKYK